MIGRLLHKADFEQALAAPARLRSTHFVLHHVPKAPSAPLTAWHAAQARLREMATPARVQSTLLCVEREKLSTGPAPTCPQAVDDAVQNHWIGCVVPKRHAKRSVTRSLLKRQIRSMFERHAATLPAGQWLVRLRAPFAPKVFVSAASEALRRTARDELEGLFCRAAA
jgi:ribonuclease P protein component